MSVCNNDPTCAFIRDPTCDAIHPKLDTTTDPNDVRFKTKTEYHNYSKYECDTRPDNMYRYLILGQRNPVQCCMSQPYITSNGKNDTIDFMRSCDSQKYAGYNRNGRFDGSIYDPKPFN